MIINIFSLLEVHLSAQVSELDLVKYDVGQYTDLSDLTFDHLGLVSFLPVSLKHEGNGRHEGRLTFEVSLLSGAIYDTDQHMIGAKSDEHYGIVEKIALACIGHSAKFSEVPGIGVVDPSDDYQVLGNTERTGVRSQARQSVYLETVQTFIADYRELLGYKKYTPLVGDIDLVVNSSLSS